MKHIKEQPNVDGKCINSTGCSTGHLGSNPKNELIKVVEVVGVQAVEKRLFRIKDLSGYLSIPISTLRKMCCYRKIPYRKLSGRIYFDKNLIDEWVNQLVLVEPVGSKGNA